MALDHRLPAICTGVFSSIGVLLAAFSGLSCNFLVRVSDGEDNIFDNELLEITSSFGVLCEHRVFSRDGDKMWELSRIFLIIGLSLGSLTAALSWAVASFLTPTNSNWNGISVLAALTAVVQVPIFVLFEAEPCIGDLEDIDLFSNAITGSGCRLGPGSLLLIGSDLFFIAVTLITQCFDRPRWGLELDIWKVHKKGESNPKTKKSKKNTPKGSRNDEYYYDDNENYDDAMRLTSRQARSLADSDGDDENNFYKISRILPAGEAKKSKEAQKTKEKKLLGFFAKLFGSSSSSDNLEVPLSKTKSMGDYDNDYENQLLHNLEIVRVLPQVDAPSDAPQSKDPSLSSTMLSAEGEEVTISAFGRVSSTVEEKDANNRVVQSFDAIVDDGTANIPWMPSAAEGNNGIASPLVEQHQMIDSPSASLLCMETNGQQQPVVSSVTDILQDLRCEEISNDPFQTKPTEAFGAATSLVPQEREREAPGEVKPRTKKLKPSDTKRKGIGSLLNFGIFARKDAYCQMSSDRSSDDVNSSESDAEDIRDSYFNYYNEADAKQQPALLMKDSENADSQTEANISALSEGIQEDEIKHVYDALNSEKEEDNSIVQDKQGDNAFPSFDSATISSTRSDSGAIFFGDGGTDFTPIVSSDSDESFSDLLKAKTEADNSWDIDFSAENFEEEDFQENSRGRSLGRNDGQRRRRTSSPVGSIKSYTSLLHMTIDEETEEDLKNELDPYSNYSFKRTLSSPELRSVIGPISTRRDRSTNELLKKLKRLKHSINVDSIRDSSRSELPPRSPRKDVHLGANATTSASTDGSFVSMDESSVTDIRKEDASGILSDLLRPDLYDTNVGEPADLPKVYHSERPKPTTIPAKLKTREGDSWRDLISPMKDTPSKERSTNLHSPIKDMLAPKEHWTKPGTPGTMDISDETSETGNTRSTISYDSDESSDGSSGPRHIRSKSMGRVKKNKKINVHRTSNSLSPTRRNALSEGKSCIPANIARESRIRRLQQLRKGGYVPLNNYHDRAESPDPYRRDLYDPASDSELTPKRKTAFPNDRDEIMSAASSIMSAASSIPNELFQPSLLEPDQPCPEFDNILDQLDLQLIDLNRPIGSEYGDDEGSM